MNIEYDRSKRKILPERRHNHLEYIRSDKSTISLFNNSKSIPPLLPRLKETTPPLFIDKLKRKRRLLIPPKQKLQLINNQKQLQDADMEKWLETTGRFPETQWRIKEKRTLKSWFDRLDRDRSGEIDEDELADPLLSTGLAKNMSEVKSLIRSVDEDKSNGIGFKEFLTVMKSKKDTTKYESIEDMKRIQNKLKRKKRIKKWTDVIDKADYSRHMKPRKKKMINPIVQLTQRENDKNMDTSSCLCLERRKLLLDATMGEAERRQRAFEKVHKWRGEMKRMSGAAKIKKLRDISKVVQQMEVNQAEKENIVLAMKGVLSKALDSNSNIDIVRPSKTAAEKDSIRRRNVMMLTKDSKHTSRTGGRHALAYPRTRTPSIPTLLGIQRKGSLL